MKIIKNLVAPSKHWIKCPYKMTATYITVHNTANDASAKNEISYMINNNNQVSYHFAVDDKEVRQGISLDRNAWHCGDGTFGNGNRKSIGVEICYSLSGGTRYKKAEQNAVKLIAQLLYERKWSIDRVKKHQDWSGKYCPHRILNEGRWSSFLKEIIIELDRLNGRLTMSQYNELKKEIGELKKEVNALKKENTELKNELTKKANAPLDTPNPSPSHAKAWEWLTETGLSNGSRPRHPITREQNATLLKKYHDKYK